MGFIPQCHGDRVLGNIEEFFWVGIGAKIVVAKYTALLAE
jgi:hypothetical protein